MRSRNKLCFWPGDKALKPVKFMNYETLQIRTEKIAQNAVFEEVLFSGVSSIKRSKYCCHPPYFLSPFFKTFVTHPNNINELDTVVPPLSSDPDTPSKFGTCTWIVIQFPVILGVLQLPVCFINIIAYIHNDCSCIYIQLGNLFLSLL